MELGQLIAPLVATTGAYATSPVLITDSGTPVAVLVPLTCSVNLDQAAYNSAASAAASSLGGGYSTTAFVIGY